MSTLLSCLKGAELLQIFLDIFIGNNESQEKSLIPQFCTIMMKSRARSVLLAKIDNY